KGTFKVAYVANPERPLFGGSSKKVCAKQAVKQTLPDQPLKIYPFLEQERRLKTELGALVFGRALLEFVYKWMSKRTPVNKVTIPEFRFVEAGYGMEGEEVANRQAFLIEEWIDTSETAQGKFRKYVNNNLPIPVENLDEEDGYRARFLCFTQHVQYVEFGKLAFVSDYQ
ncbi:hypothetical protein F5887DRAFT_848656, partial [Amanita rubescens]